MNFTEQIMLQRPAAVIDSFMAFKTMKPGYLLRITARDARDGQAKEFLVQVLSTTMDTKIGESPIVRFFKSDFALYGNNRRSSLILNDDGIIANISLSAVHIPHFAILEKASEGIFCGRDLSFENFGGKRVHAYARAISKIEVFGVEGVDLTALKKIADDFVAQVKQRNERDRRRTSVQEAILRGEIQVTTRSGVWVFQAEDKFGKRLLVSDQGDFMIAEMKSIRDRSVTFEIRSGPHKGQLKRIEYESIYPDPEKED